MSRIFPCLLEFFMSRICPVLFVQNLSRIFYVQNLSSFICLEFVQNFLCLEFVPFHLSRICLKFFHVRNMSGKFFWDFFHVQKLSSFLGMKKFRTSNLIIFPDIFQTFSENGK